MQKYIQRHTENIVEQYLTIFPAVVILGARQCGKSTLIKEMAKKIASFLYLDLQDINDLNKLTEPALFFEANKEATICLDEIQLLPNLFSVLRSEIDRNRRNGRFILLGSASRDLIQKTSESLAGRVGFIELSPFSITELNNVNYNLV
jgi:predicted AAA+ superfamily ATPase